MHSWYKAESIQGSQLLATNNKSLTEVIKKLQTGSVLQGIISDITDENNAIFTTKYGKFKLTKLLQSSDLLQNIKKNDRLSVIISENNPELIGKISKINDTKVTSANSIIMHNIINKNNTINTNSNIKRNVDLVFDQSSFSKLPQEIIDSTVTHFRLKDVKNIKLQEFYNHNIKNGTKIEFSLNIVGSNPKNTIIGEVICKDNIKQSIKTEFGILAIKNYDIPVGAKLNLNIIKINGNYIDLSSIIKDNIEQKSKDFLFKWNTISSLLLKNSSNNDKIKLHQNLFSNNIDEIIDKLLLIKENIGSEKINNLSHEIQSIKNEYIREHNSTNFNNIIYHHPIKLKDEEGSEKTQDLFIQKNDKLVKFIININTSNIGQIQLLGLLYLNNKKLVKFDLSILYKEIIDLDIKLYVEDIFNTYCKITDISGNIVFTKTKEFDEFK